MSINVSIALVVGVLLAHYLVIELMARFRYLALLFALLALCSTPFWFSKFDGWFYAVKIFSVWVPLLIFGLLKAVYPVNKKMKKWLCPSGVFSVDTKHIRSFCKWNAIW